MKIHYTGQQGGAFGWGIFGENIVKELRALGAYTDKDYEADVVFHVIANHHLDAAPGNPGPINFGMTFFESRLGERAAENAAKYDWLFVGSTWCKDRCAERGITNTEVLIQGVDREIFKPLPGRTYSYSMDDGAEVETRWNSAIKKWQPKHEQFRIFSGGKFEFRKGQDLVIAAFREFAKEHPGAHLVASWFNPWPQIIWASLAQMHVDLQPQWRGQTQEAIYSLLLQRNGLRPDQFTILPKLSQHQLAAEMANTDCGLFPNRCEGGTNLVLMEYAACGGQVIANDVTGHADVTGLIDVILESKLDKQGWAWSDDDDLRDGLHSAYEDRTTLDKIIPTWQSAAKQILLRAESLIAAKSHDQMGTSIRSTL